MRRSWQRLQLGLTASRRTSSSLPLQPFNCRRQFSAAFSPPHELLKAAAQGTSTKDGIPSAKAHKMKELARSLSLAHPNPSLLWGHYMDLVNLMEYEALPLEVHQAVLHKCTFSTAEMRVTMARNLQERTVSYRRPFHLHEARFQTVIRNIRATGDTPSLEDFHFILQHFAAVGHYLGVQSVLNELLELGIKPTHKTYGLCLQALAHRLVLPYPESDRPALVAQLSVVCSRLLSDMKTHGITITSVNLDLAVRVLREDQGEEGLSKLLRVGYGIDLRYLDRPSLEDGRQEALTDTASNTPAEEAEQAPEGFHVVQPFSTAALNTVVDILGRRSELSRMVSFFETITAPLPTNANNNNYSFEDDDDDDYHIPQSQPIWEPPHAEPNTTTYNMLIKYTAKGKNFTLARHYVERMFNAEHANRRRIRDELRVKPMDEVVATRVALNRGSLFPIYGMGHRDHNREVMRFVHVSCKKALRWKNRDLRYYSGLKRLAGQAAGIDASEAPSLETADLSPPVQGYISESPSSPPSKADVKNSSDLPHVLDLDLDKVFTPLPPRILNLDLHLSILRRDVAELTELKKRNGDHLHRAVSRGKQRLGRRIWSGKEVYMLTEGRRVKVSPDDWTKIVNFRPDKSSRER